MTRARVLMVEDERLVAQALGGRVTARGHPVVGLGASGKEAIARSPGSPIMRPGGKACVKALAMSSWTIRPHETAISNGIQAAYKCNARDTGWPSVR
jgi:hypothetical protein